MFFWKKHSKPVFIALFLLLGLLVLFLDIKAIPLFGLTLEEEILFPAFGILLLGFGLLVLNKKLSGKSDLVEELREMTIASKFFGLLSLLLLVIIIILVIFQDLSLFSFTPTIITEERIVAIVMLVSTVIFILV